MKRLIWFLLILLLAQIGLVATIRFTDRTGTERTEKGVLLDFKATDINEVLLEDGEGHHLALKKDKDRWFLPEAGLFPADTARVQDLIDRLAGMHMQRGWPEAATAEAAARFKVAPDKYVRKLNLLKDGTAQAIVYFGASPGLRKIYLRADNDPEIQSMSLSQHDLEVRVDSWIDPTVLQLKPERIKRIELPGLRLERGQDGGLQPSDLAPDEEVVGELRDALVNRLAGLMVTGLLGTEARPEYGLHPPGLQYTVELDNGTVVEYLFGQPPKPATPAEKDAAPMPPADPPLVLKVSNQEQLFKVDGWQMDELKNAARSSLVRTKAPISAAPPEPSPAPAGQAQ